jgi:hypothetical protein
MTVMTQETVVRGPQPHELMEPNFGIAPAIAELFARQRDATTRMWEQGRPAWSPDMLARFSHDYLGANPHIAEMLANDHMEFATIAFGLSHVGITAYGECQTDFKYAADGNLPTLEVSRALHANGARYGNTKNKVRKGLEKPRTNNGQPGEVHSPDGDGIDRMLREMILPLHESGIAPLFESLDIRYIPGFAPLSGGVWNGGRSAAYPPNRYAYSALGFHPIGLKNGEYGGFAEIANAAKAVRSSNPYTLHHPEHGDRTVETVGNPVLFAIHRGPGKQFIEQSANMTPDARKELFRNDLVEFCRQAYEHRLRVLVDCSHGNARFFDGNTNHELGQLLTFESLEELLYENPVIVSAGEFDAPRNITLLDVVMGNMAEIHMQAGKNPDLPGFSNVDKCLDLQTGFDMQRRTDDIQKRYKEFLDSLDPSERCMWSTNVLRNTFRLAA